ncbi:programmed cell death 1 ligand 1-like [Xiphophorus maculatus]|uniref:programmed cell death 1 ligand 1-like n=1 Tax=Xiphophorus maculatus TaxID=8083 RepID=UPI000C6EA18C|nr:programmed cell death 1 ligand 1-like [Xiphophorus maculatus]
MFHMDSVSIVHWIHMTDGDPHAHSYNSNENQVNNQNPNFRGRTSLFRDQLSRGDASLLLTGVKVQDEGKYKCYASTNNGRKELNVYLNVEAPVSEVNILQVENRIICSSDGIYPKPELTWSTIPPFTTILKYTSTVNWTEDQLYNISSSLMVSDRGSDWIYSCTVRTRSNKVTKFLIWNK